MKVENIMSRQVKACTSTDTLNRAAQLMWENDCGSLAVVSADSELKAMVTDRDICMAAYTQGASLHAIPVSHAMSKEVFACRADDDLEAAGMKMREHRVHRLPVLDGDDRLVGIISLNDIARAARGDGALKAEVADSLAAICAARPHPRVDDHSQPADTLKVATVKERVARKRKPSKR